MNKKIWTAIAAGTFLAATALPALAAGHEGTVSATVTPQLVALSILDGEVNYGFLGANASQNTVTLVDTQVVTNDGNVVEDFNVRGQDSTNWTLAATADSEQYKHEFTTTGTFGTALTTSNQSLDTDVAVNDTTNLDLKITTPTSTAATATHSVNVTVVATAN